MKKRITYFLLVFVCLFCVTGCGDKQLDKESSNERGKNDMNSNYEFVLSPEKINLPNDIDKITVFFQGEEVTISNIEDKEKLLELLSNVSKVENFKPTLLGGYFLNLYKNDDIQYKVSILGPYAIVFDDNNNYIKYTSDKEYNIYKEILVKVYAE